MEYNKHFIRLDDNNNVIHGFADAFEEPQLGDICINEQGGRHFELFGEINPPLLDDNGISLYQYKGAKITERPKTDIEAETQAKLLQPLIAAKIKESKTALAAFLEENPLVSSAHGGKEVAYSVTSEKQALLTSEMLMAQGAMSMGIPYAITWNAAGQPCELWTLEELQQLAFEIAIYVKPLVSRQQDIEVQLKACKMIEDAEAVAIDFGGEAE